MKAVQSSLIENRDHPIDAPVLTVVAPTFNEAANVPLLVERVALALVGLSWELVFVDDDSPDSTSAIAKKLGQRDARIRCIRRVGRRGLAPPPPCKSDA